MLKHLHLLLLDGCLLSVHQADRHVPCRGWDTSRQTETFDSFSAFLRVACSLRGASPPLWLPTLENHISRWKKPTSYRDSFNYRHFLDFCVSPWRPCCVVLSCCVFGGGSFLLCFACYPGGFFRVCLISQTPSMGGDERRSCGRSLAPPHLAYRHTVTPHLRTAYYSHTLVGDLATHLSRPRNFDTVLCEGHGRGGSSPWRVVPSSHPQGWLRTVYFTVRRMLRWREQTYNVQLNILYVRH